MQKSIHIKLYGEREEVEFMKLDDIVDAFLKAIEDRVGVIYLSLLLSPRNLHIISIELLLDPFLLYMQHNILTVATAGNYGPSIKLV